MHSAIATGSNNHCYNHRHKLQPQSPDLPTNSKSKNLNQKKKKKILKIFNKTTTQQINQ